MAIDLVMPKLGLTMTEGLIQEWIVKPGVPFKAGSVLLVVETEKIANEIEAVADGVLEEIVVAAGETVPCGQAIARWTPKDPAVAAAAGSTSASPLPSSSPLPVGEGQGEGTPTTTTTTTTTTTKSGNGNGNGNGNGGRVISTPYARKLARQLGVDLAAIAGSGPRGRIKGPDVKAAANKPSAVPVIEPADVASVTALQPIAPAAPITIPQIPVAAPATATRRAATSFEKTTAERLTAAKQVPHFYLGTEVEVSALEDLRRQLNNLDGKPKVTVTHLLLAALARTLVDLGDANQVWDRGEVVRFGSVDIGIAVSTDRGLLAPVVRDIGRDRIHDIAEKTRDIVDRARRNKLTPNDFGGGATSISNAGMHDVTYMTSIITPGHSSIFGIGSTREVFRPGPKGEPLLKREMGIVMSCDHRIFDGVGGLAVLNRLKFYLENPLQIVV